MVGEINRGGWISGIRNNCRRRSRGLRKNKENELKEYSTEIRKN